MTKKPPKRGLPPMHHGELLPLKSRAWALPFLWSRPLRAKLIHRLEYGRADASAAFRGGHDELLRAVHDDAGFEQHRRRLGGFQDHQLLVEAHAHVAIDELPALSRNGLRVMRAVAHAVCRQCGTQQSRKGETVLEMPVLAGDEKRIA